MVLREAARLGYYSIKRLREMGLAVEVKWLSPFYEVEFQGRRLPVYSVQQCVGKDNPVSSMTLRAEAKMAVVHAEEESPDPSENSPSSDSLGVEILLSEEHATASEPSVASRGRKRPATGSSSRSESRKGRARTRQPQGTGYFIDTPENLGIPESHKDRPYGRAREGQRVGAQHCLGRHCGEIPVPVAVKLTVSFGPPPVLDSAKLIVAV